MTLVRATFACLAISDCIVGKKLSSLEQWLANCNGGYDGGRWYANAYNEER